MVRLIALCLALWASAAQAQAQAQGWRVSDTDNGHFRSIVATASVGVDILCHAPSLERRPAIEVGAHETTPMKAGTIRLALSAERTSPARQQQRTDIVMWADSTGYRLPLAQWNELVGQWELDLPTADPLWGGLSEASQIVLAPGQEQAWALPTQGLALAIVTVQNSCAEAWDAAQRFSAPPAENRVTMPSQVATQVLQVCGAPAPVPADALQAGDLDRDGLPDFVLDWRGVTCPGPNPQPNCGAANCSHTVFLSSRGYVNPAELLGTSVTLINTVYGLGLAVSGSFSLCGPNGEYCAEPLVWDGASFTPRR